MVAYHEVACLLMPSATGVMIVTTAHFLWVVDLLWYFAFGSFPLGNAAYVGKCLSAGASCGAELHAQRASFCW